MKKNPIKKIRYRIGKSKIHGRGTFATEKIRKDTRIVEYLGEIVEGDDVDRRADSDEHVWLFDLEDGRYIFGDKNLAGPCVNHSCEPNCYTELIDGRVFIVSDRKIKPGEELTYDYRFEPDADYWPCNCGADKCRGTINLKPKKKKRKKKKKGRKSR
jgi:SET domain-containing protein